MKDGFTRRRFLKSMGQLAIGLPFLPSLHSPLAFGAGAGGSKKRFIAIRMEHGMWSQEWFPYLPSGATNPGVYSVAPYVSRAIDFRDVNLSQLPATMSPALGPAFTTLKDKIMVIQGLDAVDGIPASPGHNWSRCLAGNGDGSGAGGTGESIDQVIAAKIYSSTPTYRSLHFTIRKDGPISWFKRADGQFQFSSGYQYPRAFFDTALNNLNQTSDTQALQRAQSGKTIIDFLLRDLAGISTSTKISSEDKGRLGSHVQFLHEMEQRLNQLPGGGGCVKPARPEVYQQEMANLSTYFPAWFRAHMDNIIAAIKCGVSNVFTFNIDGGDSIDDYRFLNCVDLHGAAHNADFARLNPVRRWTLDQFAYLINALNEIEDPSTGETYLDNTLIYVGNELGMPSHSGVSMPVLLAGNVGGFFDMGRAVDFRQLDQIDPADRNRFFGRGYSQLLFTLMSSFGATSTDWQSRVNIKNIFSGATTKYAADWNKLLSGMKRMP